jgi:signal transduction histidine kinase
MPIDLRPLLRPLNLAAVLVWVAVGYELLMGTPRERGALDGQTAYFLSLALHKSFLLLVLLPPVLPPRLRLGRALPWVALVVALLEIWLRPSTSTPVLLIVVMAQLAGNLEPRPLALTWAATNGLLFVLFSSTMQRSSPFIATLLYSSFQLFAMTTAWYSRSAEQARDALAAVNAELLATRSLLAESARDQERLRLARELHDVAGHKLTALKLNLAAAARDPASGRNPEVALSARLADELLGDIRGVVAQMRAHDGMNLRAAIEQLAAPLPRLRVHIDVDPEATVASVEQAEAVVRAVQEALTNAARHSAADNVWIALRRDGAQLRIEVRDDGRASTPLRFGNGLTGMRERLQALGGGLTIERAPEGGVAVHGWLQLA